MRIIDSLHEIQQIEMDMLLFVDRICKEQNLRYFLAGGTLLGAVRHHGFIPWDNDVDISMPRRDYKKLLSIIAEGKTYYKILQVKNENNYIYTYAKIVDTRTVLRENDIGYKVDGLGIYIDIFPLDGIKKNNFFSRKKFMAIRKMAGIIARSNVDMLSINGKNRLFKIVIKKILKHFGRERLFNYAESLLSNNDFDKSRWIVSTYGRRKEKEIIARSAFSKCVDFQFEDYSLKGPIGYDTYLKQMYGDYLELPPEEQRQPPHDIEAYWKV